MERETSKTITIPIEWAKAMYEAHTGKTVDEDFVKTYKQLSVQKISVCQPKN